MDRLVQFLNIALSDRNWKLTKIDDLTCDLVSADGVRKKRFTLDRETATANEGVDLLGLDHPICSTAFGVMKFRCIKVSKPDFDPGLRVR